MTYTLRVCTQVPCKPELVLLRKHVPETCGNSIQTHLITRQSYQWFISELLATSSPAEGRSLRLDRSGLILSFLMLLSLLLPHIPSISTMTDDLDRISRFPLLSNTNYGEWSIHMEVELICTHILHHNNIHCLP